MGTDERSQADTQVESAVTLLIDKCGDAAMEFKDKMMEVVPEEFACEFYKRLRATNGDIVLHEREIQLDGVDTNYWNEQPFDPVVGGSTTKYLSRIITTKHEYGVDEFIVQLQEEKGDGTLFGTMANALAQQAAHFAVCWTPNIYINVEAYTVTIFAYCTAAKEVR